MLGSIQHYDTGRGGCWIVMMHNVLNYFFFGKMPFLLLQFWRMEFLQVPETPAPEPVEPPEVNDCCGEEKMGK